MNTMKKSLYLLLLLISTFSFSQVGIGTTTPHASAVLDVTSTTKGFLPPRMTLDQRKAIESPIPGLMVWCTDCGSAGELQVNNGTTWTNMIGGTASGESVPGAPTSIGAAPSNAQASVSFTAPASNGGSVITSYTVTSSPQGVTSTGISSPLIVTGLTNGTSYNFTVKASNAVGNSAPSLPSPNVVPFTIPGAPTSPVATAGNAQASVAFVAPASNGGSVITSYTVTSSPASTPVSGSSSPIVVTGLNNGTAYTFTVVATNAAGYSVTSSPSGAVTPSQCFANVGGTTKLFMCYNLGVAGTQDPFTYQSGNNNGAYYQWGRQTDGHQLSASTPQAGPASGPVANRFITNSTSPNDWINPQNNSLWLDGSKTANDPCPAGFRVPTQAQWGGLFKDGTTSGAPSTATRNTWTWTGSGFTVGANLYLPAAGSRNVNGSGLYNVSTYGNYWSSSVNGTNANYIFLSSGNVNPADIDNRGQGFTVRCISE